MTGSDCGGFARSVASIVSGDANSLEMLTGNASLADVFRDAHLEGVATNQGAPSLRSRAAAQPLAIASPILAFLFQDSFSISPSGSASITFTPEFSFSPTLYHRIIIEHHSFVEATLIAQGQLSVGLVLSIASSAEIGFSWSHDFAPQPPLCYILLPGLDIPVAIGWHIFVGATISFSMAEHVSIGARSSFVAQLGASYTRANGFQSIASLAQTPVAEPNAHAQSCTASVDVKIGAGITFKVFDMTPSLAMDFEVGLELARAWNSPNPTCPCMNSVGGQSIYNALKFVFGPSVSLQVLILSHTWDLAQSRTPLVDSCDTASTHCGGCFCDPITSPPGQAACCPWTPDKCHFWIQYWCLCVPRWDGKGVCVLNAHCNDQVPCNTDKDCQNNWICTGNLNPQCKSPKVCSQPCGPFASNRAVQILSGNDSVIGYLTE